MPSEPIKIAVVGYGYWGPNLVRNFAKSNNCQVAIVSDFDASKLAACARLYPGIKTTTRFRDVVEFAEIGAVAIATPAHSHFELAMAALKAGKHVLVEKPLAQSSDEVRRLIDEAMRRNLTLMVDHTFVYTPAVQKIRQLIAEGALGQIFYYDGTRASLGLFQKDVNVVWDLAIHDLSIIQHILNEAPVAVSATGATHVSGSPENMAHITLFFESSCVAHISVNWLSPIKVRQTFIGGSSKMIVYDDLEPTEKVKVYDKGITLDRSSEDAHQFRIGYRAGDMWAPHISAQEALQTEVEHFVDCVRTGAPPISSGISGLRVVEVLEAASRSIVEQGKPVLLKQRSRVVERVMRQVDVVAGEDPWSVHPNGIAMTPVQRSILFSAAERYASLMLFFVSTAVLSRLLTPKEFGIYAVVNALTSIIAASFQEFGGANYLIQKHDLSSADVRTAFTITLGVSVATTVVLFELSGVLARLFAQDDLGSAIAVSALNFLFVPFSGTVSALFRRDMEFGRIAICNLVSRRGGRRHLHRACDVELQLHGTDLGRRRGQRRC